MTVAEHHIAVAHAVREATGALNAAIGEAADAGIDVEVHTLDISHMGDRRPRKYVEVRILVEL